jgi:quercetin dioxygenase-like cupin family protein
MPPARLLAGTAVVLAVVAGSGRLEADTSHGGPVEHVALDNDTVKVTIVTMAPGSSSGIHINAEPEMGIVAEGSLTMVTRDGKRVYGPGSVVWLPPRTGHEARNETTRPLKVYALGLKRCE